MNEQKIFNAIMAEARTKRLANSEQLMLGELKLKLLRINGKSKPIFFDFGMKPAGECSWRGSYCELGLKYSENGGGTTSWNGKLIKKHSDYEIPLKECEEESHSLPENPTTQNFIDMLKAITNKEFLGYKGGEFIMHKNVAVYFGNYGESFVNKYFGKDYVIVAPIDVIEMDDAVVIITKEVEY